VYVTVPSHETLAQRFPARRDELERVRYRVSGVDGVQPQGALMYRRGPLALAAWPEAHRSVIKVEAPSTTLGALLVDHCRLPPAPWLFKLREPGVATEVRTCAVRPSGRYILLSLDDQLGSAGIGVSLPLATRGVHALQLDVPDEVNNDAIAELRALGVGVVSDVVVWPAGLVPATWDGEGRATWPAGESSLIGIRSSRSVERCVVSTEVEVLQFAWPTDSDCVFVELRDAGPGSHTVDVALLADGDTGPLAQGQLLLQVLEPADSAATAGARQALQVRSHPARPTLEELWSGDAAIVADGPHGEKIQVDLSLMNRGGRKVLARTSFSSTLPMGEERWRELFRGARGSPEFSSAYHEAEEISVALSNPSLGSTDLRAERPFSPLRWVTGQDRDGPYARLIDHMGSDELVIEYYDAPTPAKVDLPTVNPDNRVHTSNGGLVLARAGGYRVAAALPPHVSGGLEVLKKLQVRPTLPTGPRSLDSVVRMIRLDHVWSRLATPADDNAARLQSQVNAAVVSRLAGMIGGSRWLEQESELLDGRVPSDRRLLDAVGGSSDERRVASHLLEVGASVGRGPTERLVSFCDALVVLRVAASLAEFVLRLATVPGSISTDRDDTVEAAIEQVLHRPILLRLARLFVVAAAARHPEERGAHLRSWQWD
jgi:hypothetical protein